MVVRIAVASVVALAFAGAAFAQDTAAQGARVTEGDTLLIERVQEENTAAMPARGMSTQDVEAKFGAPASKLDPRGGQKRQWPTINRWNRVIDAVANKADANEVGPKPAIR